MALGSRTRRLLAIARNVDVAPIGATEAFGTVSGSVANDGQPHELTLPAGASALVIDPTHRLRIKRVRVEWQQLDLSVPPPLSITLLVNGVASVGANVLSKLFLLAVAVGTPAAELPVYVEVAPGAHFQIFATNTGAVNPQIVSASFWGWSYPATLFEGASYAN